MTRIGPVRHVTTSTVDPYGACWPAAGSGRRRPDPSARRWRTRRCPRVALRCCAPQRGRRRPAYVCFDTSGTLHRRVALRQHDRRASRRARRCVPARRRHADHGAGRERRRCTGCVGAPVDEADRVELLLGRRPRLALDRRHRDRRRARPTRSAVTWRAPTSTTPAPGDWPIDHALRVGRGLRAPTLTSRPAVLGELRSACFDVAARRSPGPTSVLAPLDLGERRRRERDGREQHDRDDQRHEPALPGRSRGLAARLPRGFSRAGAGGGGITSAASWSNNGGVAGAATRVGCGSARSTMPASTSGPGGGSASPTSASAWRIVAASG